MATFVPKVPLRRVKKTTTVKKEIGESADINLSSNLQKLIKQSTEGAGRGGYGADRKSPQVQVAFGYGSSNTFGRGAPGNCRGGSGGGGSSGGGGLRGSDKKPSINDGMHGGMFIDKTGKQTKEFVDPMDFSSYYPVTLPLRKPYSGKSASTSLPLGRLLIAKTENDTEMNNGPNGKTVSRSDDKVASSVGLESNADSSILEKFPAGIMGKPLVYESGAVKMKLGDALLDDVAAINSVTKQCCFLGDINKPVTLVPDVDSLLDSTIEIGLNMKNLE